MRFVAVDLHKTLIVACYLEDGTFKHKSFKMQDIDKFKDSLQKSDELCFETTTNSSWFYYQCKNLVSRIVVVNTSMFAVISNSVNKTDKHDAKTLAIYLSKNMLPEVRVKDIRHQELQTLFTARKLLTKQTTMLKNELHGVLLGQGIAVSHGDLSSNVGLDRITKLCKAYAIEFALISLANSLKSLNQSIKELDRKLEELGSELPGYKNLKSIKGLGANTIVLLLTTIGNINDFATHNKLSAYIGFVPSVRNSNQSIKHGRITKRGNSLLRGNLVMCALSAILKNKQLEEFYLRIKQKGGYRKAIVATANRLVKIIYFTLRYNWYFTDFGNQKRETLPINWDYK